MATLEWWKDKLDRALLIKPRPRKEPSIYATFYERMMASAIDMGVMIFALGPTMNSISRKIYSQMSPEQVDALTQTTTISDALHQAAATGFLALWLVNSVLQMMLIGVAYISCQMLFKNTPGKWLLGLKLTTSDNQTFPAVWRLVLRFIGYGIACLPLLLGIVWMNFDKQSRGWHDWLAGTRVITTRPDGWYWAQTKRGFFWAKERLLRK
ncbi:MAG: RDD family protein [Alphaproteobacteria bacterium]|nr:RDD family protein [Alphaproteobacteria bacterium]